MLQLPGFRSDLIREVLQTSKPYVIVVHHRLRDAEILGDEEAKALGADVRKYRTLGIISAILATSATTSIAGMVTWIGVVSPHIARLLVGVDNRRLVPATALVSASLLLLCDDIAGSLMVAELPLSVVTNFIGAPILFTILVKRKFYYVKD